MLQAVEQFPIVIDFCRTEVPKGCRKPRAVPHQDTYLVTIPRTDADSAPVAIVRTDPKTGETQDYRFWDGKLYVKSKPTWLEGYAGSRYSQEREVRRRMEEQFEPFLSIDGEVWERTDEPHYAIDDSFRSTSINVETSFAGGGPEDAHRVRIDEPECAARLAREIAESGCGVPMYDFSKDGPAYDVRLPDALTIKPYAWPQSLRVQITVDVLGEVGESYADVLERALAAVREGSQTPKFEVTQRWWQGRGKDDGWVKVEEGQPIARPLVR